MRCSEDTINNIEFQPVNIDLTLSDVASEIRNGMGDIIVGHGQDRNLRKR